MRAVFVVQGEGRGHMTQALALAEALRGRGHTVDRVLVGVSAHRSLPEYFVDRIAADVIPFDAPTQVPDRERRGMSVTRTAFDAATRLPAFVRSGFAIHRAAASAEVVVHFLDLIGGLSRALLRTTVPAVAVGHNYLFSHPELAGAPGRPTARRLLGLYTRGTALGCRARVALSFGPLREGGPADLRVAPPLLRRGLASLEVRDDGFLLAYALNPGYAGELARWQLSRPEVTVRCYVDGGPAAFNGGASTGFSAHDLNDHAFLADLARCRAYVGSAGFESLCEAHYLGKPVLAVPTAGQLEQEMNAWDAERCGVARAGSYADLDPFWDHPPTPTPAAVSEFRAWVDQGRDRVADVVEAARAA